jgi:shikimate 5-dehydrogenase
VTSPLKTEFNQDPVNTLRFKNGAWESTNTDLPALRGVMRALGLDSSQLQIAVWGQGGMKQSIREIFPTASFHSPRLKKGRELCQEELERLYQDLLYAQLWIWSAPPLAPTPLSVWKELNPGAEVLTTPKQVVVYDLNYREDSLAKKFAYQIKARFFSGLDFFIRQAVLQREFWRS